MYQVSISQKFIRVQFVLMNLPWKILRFKLKMKISLREFVEFRLLSPIYVLYIFLNCYAIFSTIYTARHFYVLDEQHLPVNVMYCSYSSRVGIKVFISRIVYSSCTRSSLQWSKLCLYQVKTKVTKDLIDKYSCIWLKFCGICPRFLVGQ